MWIRYHIKCHNCEKITNLRLELSSTTKIEAKFKCPNEECTTDLKGILYIDYPKFKNYKPSIITKIKGYKDKSYNFKMFQKNFQESLDFKVERGIQFFGGFNEGDYFVEYANGLCVATPNSTGHNRTTPFLRQNPKTIMEGRAFDQLRNLYGNELWQDLIDLIVAFQNSNNNAIRLIAEKMKPKCLGIDDIKFTFEEPIDHIHAFFNLLNHFLFPWIEMNSHNDFVLLIFKELFSKLYNLEVQNMCIEYTTPHFLKKFNHECGEILIRFIQRRDLFRNIYQGLDISESIISNPNFEEIKTLYTDGFEFLGRYSMITLKLMNLIERGSISNMTTNKLSIEDFEFISHGNRMDIINKSSTKEILEIFDDRFDSKLRNGINHFKTKMNSQTQIISYCPSTNKPNEEYTISYHDFLSKTLNIVESVMRLNQIIKFFHFFNVERTRENTHQ